MSRKRNRGNGEGSIFKRYDGGPWYITWFDHDGKRKRICTKTTDKTTAQRILADKLADVAMRREGVIDARLEAIIIEAKKPIEKHLVNYQAMLEARRKGKKSRHIANTLTLIREVCKAAAFETPADISADGMNTVIAEVRAKGKSVRTAQARIVAMKSFTRWLVDHDKMSLDPLRIIKRGKVKKADRVNHRRMLLPDEWPYLKSGTFAAGVHHGMNPFERVTLYAVAIQTGLRQDELRSLTKSDVFVAAGNPFIKCRALNTKNADEARQSIDADLAESLRQIVAPKTPTANVFNMPDLFHVAEMLRQDLASARKLWLGETKHDPDERTSREESDFLAVKNHQGETLDFHSLRHTCGAWLALQGVHPNVIKTVMRHSTITLTMDTYGHLLPNQHADAVTSLAGMMAAPGDLAATGTAGSNSTGRSTGRSRDAKKSGMVCGTVRTDAKLRQHGTERVELKPLQIADVCEPLQTDASGSENASCRARTYDPLIKSQLLYQLS